MGVGCVLATLKEAGWDGFIDEWKESVVRYFPDIDLMKPQACQELLIRCQNGDKISVLSESESMTIGSEEGNIENLRLYNTKGPIRMNQNQFLYQRQGDLDSILQPLTESSVESRRSALSSIIGKSIDEYETAKVPSSIDYTMFETKKFQEIDANITHKK